MDDVGVQLVLLLPDMDPVATPLGDVQGAIRQTNESLRVASVLGIQSDADTDAQLESHRRTDGGDRLSDAIRDLEDSRSVVHEEYNDELVAAPTEHEIGVPRGLLDGSGHGLQDPVAELVATSVVDALEVVEVAQENREAFLRAYRSGDLLLDTFVEVPAIVEVREGISDGKVRQGSLGLFSLRDISDDRQASNDVARLAE